MHIHSTFTANMFQCLLELAESNKGSGEMGRKNIRVLYIHRFARVNAEKIHVQVNHAKLQ